MNFCLVLNHVDGDLGLHKDGGSKGKEIILKHTFLKVKKNVVIL